MHARALLATLAASAVLVPGSASGLPQPDRGRMQVASSAFADGGTMAARYSCDGEGSSPPLTWWGLPLSTKTVALIVDDPDAPNGTFVHWVVYNLPPSATELPEDAARDKLPLGAEEGKNGKGENGWTPPCPPWGRHHYHFRVFALRDSVVLSNPSADELMRTVRGLTLAQGEMVGTYQRGRD
jgi:Raf kinase inhibitor-like YbhB/YbcL family protein